MTMLGTTIHQSLFGTCLHCGQPAPDSTTCKDDACLARWWDQQAWLYGWRAEQAEANARWWEPRVAALRAQAAVCPEVSAAAERVCTTMLFWKNRAADLRYHERSCREVVALFESYASAMPHHHNEVPVLS